MKPEIQVLIDRYKKTPGLTERQKAEIEAQIWAIWPHRDQLRRNVMRDLLDALPAYSDYRFSLHRMGDLADELWRRVEELTLPLGMAADILRDAKARSREEKIPLQSVLTDLLDEYDRRPFTKKSGEYTFRWGKPKPKLDFEPTTLLDQGDRNFWKWIRENVGNLIRTKMEGLDPVLAEEVYQKFDVDLRVVIDETYSKISRLKLEKKSVSEESKRFIDREAVHSACRTLNIDPPRWNSSVDLAIANRNKKRLASAYHPDKHKGDESMRHQYEQVLDAYSTLEEYNARIKNPTGEVTDGGTDDDGR